MPRVSHGRPLLKSGPARPAKRKPRRNAALNALETAERQNPDSIKIRQHRLGEVEDDSDVPETRADVDGHSSKRRKVTNERGEEEDIEKGSDLEGGTWHVGVNDEDEDSDLDSDEAFGASDEEKFADFTFRGSGIRQSSKPTTKRRPRAMNLDENIANNDGDNEDEEDDDLGDEAVDLATAWDMDDADQHESQKKPKKSARLRLDKSSSTDESEGTENDDTEENSTGSEVGSQDDESQFSLSADELHGDTAGLRSFVESLSTTQSEKKQPARFDSSALPNKPSRFGLPSSKLSASDLLQYIKDPIQRQSLKVLQSAERTGSEPQKGGIAGKLSAPLARRQQDKLDRGAAYDKSKETLNRWIDTVKQNRRADHLSFPLVDHAAVAVLGSKQLVPTSQTAPATDLEATISGIMQESGMAPSKGQTEEDYEHAYEELAEKKMDVEEVKARRAELRMARELLFREEIRAKRIKKIKSKAYRRVHRKERDRLEAQHRDALAAAGVLNSDEERELQDRKRAEERMGARHRESRWAKGVKQAGRATWDEDARAGVSDLAKRDEELRRRILGKGFVASDASNAESESDSDYDADTDTEGQKLIGKLDTLQTSGGVAAKSKLGQMAFMQRAEAARKAENDEEIRQLRLAVDDDVDGQRASEGEYQTTTGRQKYGTPAQAKPLPRQSKPKNEFEAPLSDDEVADDTIAPVMVAETPNQIRSPVKARLRVEPQLGGLGRSTQTKTKGDDSSRSRHNQRHETSNGLKRQRQIKNEKPMDEYTSPSESEEETHDSMNPDEVKAALAASIFAGPDDAAQDFAREKADLVEEEGDQVIDNTLPGWGSWTGTGVSKREQKKGKGRFLTTIKGVAPEKRQDAKLERVIVNEKRIKKNGRYLATELPHPFESRQQYERSLRLPIGPEWSTVNHYQDAIKPRVLLKQGTVIRPIAKPIA